MIFDLVHDFADVLDAMPQGHPRRRILKLLDEAIRRDVHFIDRHPTTLFQCLWNTCWWYDCPEAAGHYELDDESNPDAIPWLRTGPHLSSLLQEWRSQRDGSQRSTPWFRSLRPPRICLGQSQVARLVGHKRTISRVVFSPNGRHILTTSRDRTARVWDVASGECVRTLAGHSGEITDAAISADGRTIITSAATGEDTIRVWDFESGESFFQYNEHASVEAVEFFPDSQRIATGNSYGSMTIRNLGTGKVCGFYTHRDSSDLATDSPVQAIAISPNGDRIASGDKNGGIIVYDVNRNRKAAELHTETWVFGLEFGQNDDELLVTQGNQVTRIRVSEGSLSRLAVAPDDIKDQLVDVCYDPMHHRVAAGCWNNEVFVWDAADGHLIYRYTGHTNTLCCVDYSAEMNAFASGAWDADVHVWRVADESPPIALIGHEAPIMCLGVSPDESQIATGSVDESVQIWDTRTGHRMCRLVGHQHPVDEVLFSEDGSRLLSRSVSKSRARFSDLPEDPARIWNVRTGDCIGSIPDDAIDREKSAKRNTHFTYSKHAQYPQVGGPVYESVLLVDGGVQLACAPVRCNAYLKSCQLLYGYMGRDICLFRVEGERNETRPTEQIATPIVNPRGRIPAIKCHHLQQHIDSPRYRLFMCESDGPHQISGVLELEERCWVIILADAGGPMPDRAEVIRQCCELFIEAVSRRPSTLSELLTGFNQQLIDRVAEKTGWASVFAGFVSENSDVVEVAVAGLPNPILRHRDGTIGSEVVPMVPLGLVPDYQVETDLVEFLPGDNLVVFTDGLLVIEQPDGKSVTEDQIRELVVATGDDTDTIGRLLTALDVDRKGRGLPWSLVVLGRR